MPKKELIPVGTIIGEMNGKYKGKIQTFIVFYGNACLPVEAEGDGVKFVHLPQESYNNILRKFLMSKEGADYEVPTTTKVLDDAAKTIENNRQGLYNEHIKDIYATLKGMAEGQRTQAQVNEPKVETKPEPAKEEVKQEETKSEPVKEEAKPEPEDNHALEDAKEEATAPEKAETSKETKEETGDVSQETSQEEKAPETKSESVSEPVHEKISEEKTCEPKPEVVNEPEIKEEPKEEVKAEAKEELTKPEPQKVETKPEVKEDVKVEVRDESKDDTLIFRSNKAEEVMAKEKSEPAPEVKPEPVKKPAEAPKDVLSSDGASNKKLQDVMKNDSIKVGGFEFYDPSVYELDFGDDDTSKKAPKEEAKPEPVEETVKVDPAPKYEEPKLDDRRYEKLDNEEHFVKDEKRPSNPWSLEAQRSSLDLGAISREKEDVMMKEFRVILNELVDKNIKLSNRIDNFMQRENERFYVPSEIEPVDDDYAEIVELIKNEITKINGRIDKLTKASNVNKTVNIIMILILVISVLLNYGFASGLFVGVF